MAKKTMSTKLTKAELVFNEDGTITVIVPSSLNTNSALVNFVLIVFFAISHTLQTLLNFNLSKRKTPTILVGASLLGETKY